MLDRHPATICREIHRNSGLRGYRPKQAQMLSDTRRYQAYKARKISDEAYGQIETLLRQELSPQQVASYLKRHKASRCITKRFIS